MTPWQSIRYVPNYMHGMVSRFPRTHEFGENNMRARKGFHAARAHRVKILNQLRAVIKRLRAATQTRLKTAKSTPANVTLKTATLSVKPKSKPRSNSGNTRNSQMFVGSIHGLRQRTVVRSRNAAANSPRQSKTPVAKNSRRTNNGTFFGLGTNHI